MTRKNTILKTVIFTAIVLIAMFSLLSLNSFADGGSMYVTDYITAQWAGPASQISQISSITSSFPATKSYDDGTYAGTLIKQTGFIIISSQYIAYPDVYLYNFQVAYAGTVTLKGTPTDTPTPTPTPTVTPIPGIGATKTVTDYITAQWGGPSSQAYTQISSIVSSFPATKSYDDGEYAGTLTKQGGYSIVSSQLIQSPDIYLYTYKAPYAGTVTKYQ